MEQDQCEAQWRTTRGRTLGPLNFLQETLTPRPVRASTSLDTDCDLQRRFSWDIKHARTEELAWSNLLLRVEDDFRQELRVTHWNLFDMDIEQQRIQDIGNDLQSTKTKMFVPDHDCCGDLEDNHYMQNRHDEHIEDPGSLKDVNGAGTRIGIDDRAVSPIPGIIPNVNTYQQKKNLAQGMMDLALLSANAGQLRYVLEATKTHPYYYTSIGCISISIIAQVMVGIGLIVNSRYDINDLRDIYKADRINNMTVLGIFLITFVNVFIAAFSVATPVGPDGHPPTPMLRGNATL